MLIPWLAPSGFLLMGSLSAALVVAPGIAVLARQFFSTEEMLVTNLRVMKKREGRWDMRPDPDRPRPTRGRYIASATPEIPLQRGLPFAFKITEIDGMELDEVREVSLGHGRLGIVLRVV